MTAAIVADILIGAILYLFRAEITAWSVRVLHKARGAWRDVLTCFRKMAGDGDE